MSRRSTSQAIGSRGQRFVQYTIEEVGGWIARGQDEDFGVDLEAELASEGVHGDILKIQVKTQQRLKANDSHISLVIKRDLLRYAENCRVPMILVSVCLDSKKAWYLWMQRWLLTQRRNGRTLNAMPYNVSIEISLDDELAKGLAGELQDIAKLKNHTQLLLSLSDTLRTAAAVSAGDTATALIQILSNLDALLDDFPIDVIIDQVLSLGPDIRATSCGNHVSRTLYAVCDKLGSRFSRDQVHQLVCREDASYSRTGLLALGILYDKYPDHISSLQLPALFKDTVAWYCAMREHYSGEIEVKLAQRCVDFTHNGWSLHPDAKEHLFDKWMNRGSSAFIDYLYCPDTKDLPETT
jgi:hypothetical protein